jgi:hypothetical protein
MMVQDHRPVNTYTFPAVAFAPMQIQLAVA